MERADLALVISLLLVAAVAGVTVLSVRYRKYDEDVRRGKRRAKPVWRPFWMN